MKKLTCTLGLLAILAGSAGAVTLWDQSDYDLVGSGFFNTVAGMAPMGMTVHTVNHVTVPEGEMWNVDTITIYFSCVDQSWGSSITQGNLHVFNKSAALPVDGTDDPTASTLVTMSGTFLTDHIEVTASGLGLSLSPGEYWIGITPYGTAGFFGPEIHLPSQTLYGDASASYDPYGMPVAWYNMNAGVDAAILIEGNLVVSNEAMAWGDMKSLYR